MELSINTQIFYSLITSKNDLDIEIKEIASADLRSEDGSWFVLTVHEADNGVEYYVVERQEDGDEPVHRFLKQDEAIEYAKEVVDEMSDFFDKVNVDGELDD